MFYEQAEKDHKQYDERKPAMFRTRIAQEEDEKPKTYQQEFEEMTPDGSQSFEQLKSQFKVAEGNQVRSMENESFNLMHKALKQRQIRFYAFLNKEFNQLNYKSARWSFHWYDDINTSTIEAMKCVQICREGIVGCHQFAKDIQAKAEEETKKCEEQAKDIKIVTDPIIHWISWYEKLILKFDEMEGEIQSEFSNFI